MPQMLLNAQGCTHAETIDGSCGSGDGAGLGRKGGSSAAGSVPAGVTKGDDNGGASPGGRALRALSAGSGEDGDSTPEEAVVEGQPGAEETKPWSVPAADCRGDQPRTTEVCRCRQAMRLLTRLVRGLPGESPAVVVRHSGLRSIVKILEEAAAASAKEGAHGWLPAAVEAAAGEALEVSVVSRAKCRSVVMYCTVVRP